MSNPSVLVVCGDPGGANAVAPVIEALRAGKRVTVKAMAYRQAQSLWGRRSLAFVPLPENTTPADAAAQLRNFKAGLLVAGTSVNPVELEKIYIAAARKVGIPSLAVLDFWSNYRMRFSDQVGNLAYLPDRIAVMDERARDEMIADGFKPAKLVITGQPALDELALRHRRFTPTRRDEIRGNLGIKSGEKLVLFASETFSTFYGPDPTAPGHIGYTEKTVLRTLLSALENIAKQTGWEIVLVIRPHLKESGEEYESFSGRLVRVIVSTEGESRELVMAADVVTGMHTMLLVEACYLGRVPVSLQPGLRLPDALPTNRSGQSILVDREKDFEPVLKRMLLDPPSRKQSVALPTVGEATKRVVKLAYRMLGLDEQA